MIQFVGWNVVAEKISAVVSEPHFSRRRMPVEANAVAHAAGENLRPRAVRLHAQDRGKPRVVRTFADIAWPTDGNVEKPVGSESNELLAVMRLGRQIAFHHRRRRRLFECGFNVVVSSDATDLGDVEGAISKRDAAWVLQSLGDRVDLIGFVVVVPIDDGVHLVVVARADK